MRQDMKGFYFSQLLNRSLFCRIYSVLLKINTRNIRSLVFYIVFEYVNLYEEKLAVESDGVELLIYTFVDTMLYVNKNVKKSSVICVSRFYQYI